jgi:hypothetical protein
LRLSLVLPDSVPPFPEQLIEGAPEAFAALPPSYSEKSANTCARFGAVQPAGAGLPGGATIDNSTRPRHVTSA